jgi:hypothetical protein
MKLLLKTTCIFGLRGSGKTTWAESIAENQAFHSMVYDTVREYPTNKKFDVYRPVDSNSTSEFIAFLKYYIKREGKAAEDLKAIPKYNLLLVDEFNRFAPGGGKALHPALMDLNDQLRHPPYQIGVVYIARRPTQIHPDIVGLADNILCFHLTGKNDITFLNDTKKGYGDAVENLDKYHSVLLRDGVMQHVLPIKPGGKLQ